jgi:hypothetical protein
MIDQEKTISHEHKSLHEWLAYYILFRIRALKRLMVRKSKLNHWKLWNLIEDLVMKNGDVIVICDSKHKIRYLNCEVIFITYFFEKLSNI